MFFLDGKLSNKYNPKGCIKSSVFSSIETVPDYGVLIGCNCGEDKYDIVLKINLQTGALEKVFPLQGNHGGSNPLSLLVQKEVYHVLASDSDRVNASHVQTYDLTGKYKNSFGGKICGNKAPSYLCKPLNFRFIEKQ